jgi:hypothetical protein
MSYFWGGGKSEVEVEFVDVFLNPGSGKICTLLFEAGMRVCKNAADVSPGVSSASRMADPVNCAQVVVVVGVPCRCDAATSRGPCLSVGSDGWARCVLSPKWRGVKQGKLWGRRSFRPVFKASNLMPPLESYG